MKVGRQVKDGCGFLTGRSFLMFEIRYLRAGHFSPIGMGASTRLRTNEFNLSSAGQKASGQLSGRAFIYFLIFRSVMQMITMH